VTLEDREDGEYLIVKGGPENYDNSYGPYAKGEYIVGPGDKFAVYVAFTGEVFVLKFGDPNPGILDDIKWFDAIVQGSTPDYELELQPQADGTYSIYIKEI
jgi:hypothetical protein